MKHGKRPTTAQRKLMQKWKNQPENWLVVKDTPREMVIVHRLSGQQKTIPKIRED